MWMLKNSNLKKATDDLTNSANMELQKYQKLMAWKFNQKDIYIITKTGFYLVDNLTPNDNSKIDLDLGTTLIITELDSIVSELPWKHLSIFSENNKQKKYKVRICHLLNDYIYLSSSQEEAITFWANTKWNWMIDKLEDYKKLEIINTNKLKNNINQNLDLNAAVTYKFTDREQYIDWLEKERQNPENENDYRYTITNEVSQKGEDYITVYVFKNIKNLCATCDKEYNEIDCANCKKGECCGKCNF